MTHSNEILANTCNSKQPPDSPRIASPQYVIELASQVLEAEKRRLNREAD